MRNYIARAAAFIAAVSLCSCGAGDMGEKGDNEVSVTPVAAALSAEPHGYGQGVIVDERNRPVGALDFNEKYGSLGAYAIGEDEDRITLTFDQGYENGYTDDILDTLKEKNVSATFFIVQDYAERNPELVQRMIDEGHTVANHSVHHYSMPTLDEGSMKEEIMGFHEYMQENFGADMTLFRPPMGEFSERSLKAAQDCGYTTVMWSFAYADWDVNDQPDPAWALDKLTKAAHPGAVYLLHSVSATNAEILGELIDALRAEGYAV
ncbi:MAG: polysaccharide deacetylase family protein [Ruminococcus sp.]|nr:polysaccharide deacetylase family protein [Ruminococcus sp.]